MLTNIVNNGHITLDRRALKMKKVLIFIMVIAAIVATTFTLPASATELDSDDDGVYDDQDLCPGTEDDEPERHGTNRWKWFEKTEGWVQKEPRGNGKGPKIDFSIKETHGCNCNQILTWLQGHDPEVYGQMEGHRKFGCSTSIMQEFVALTVKGWKLPSDQIGLMVWHPSGSNYYFDIELSDVGSGYDIWDGVWPGWCADSHVYIYQNVNYNPSVYSSLDPTLGNNCEYCADDERWNYVNYILNHKHPDANWTEIQAAIWYFTDTDPDYQNFWTWRSQAMVDDALANGAHFYPSSGEFGAVILAVNSNTQLVFIEVDP